MIHEALFNLWNMPIDVLDKNDWTCLLELQEFSHPGEEELFISILELTKDYHKIFSFNQNVLNQISNKSTGENVDSANQNIPKGLYIQAFCSGAHKVLEGYRKQILKLEEQLLENPGLPLTYILSTVFKYKDLFSVLKTMVQVIQGGVSGCLLIGRLHNFINCGNEEKSAAADQIIQSINTVFYRHLCNWIIYGDLVDIYGEFFICDAKCADGDFLYPEQMEESLSDSKKHVNYIRKSKLQRPPTVRKFYINWNMVPLFINEETAESILFMGRIVWIFRNDPKKSGDNQYQITYKKDIWEGKHIEYYKKLQALSTQTFNEASFKETVEECRLKLTKYLWTVMLDEGNLTEHLQLIRDYYALGRGELFQTFITVAENHINDSNLESFVQNLNSIFLETAKKIYGENDKTIRRFELTAPKSDILGSNPWSHLQMNFEINWPLHIVFHPKVMELYNKLFGFLMRVRKTQIDLNKLWQQHVSLKQKIDRRVLSLRQKLMFLVNYLQYYFQVDVIEAEFSILFKAVQNAKEFEDMIKLHHEFISNLLAKTFVLTPDDTQSSGSKHQLYRVPALQYDTPSKIYNIIIRLLEVCDEFCAVASTWEINIMEPELKELESFQERTDVIVDCLMQILISMQEKVSGHHLLQLVLHLNYNQYFTKNKSVNLI